MNWPVDDQSCCLDSSTTVVINLQHLPLPLLPETAIPRLTEAQAGGEHAPNMRTAAALRWATAPPLPDVVPLVPAVTAPKRSELRKKNSYSFVPEPGICSIHKGSSRSSNRADLQLTHQKALAGHIFSHLMLVLFKAFRLEMCT